MTSTPTAALDADLHPLREAASALCKTIREGLNGEIDAGEMVTRENQALRDYDAAESRLRSTLRARDERIEALEQENERLRVVAYLADIYLEHDGTRKNFNAGWLYDTRRKLESSLAAIDLVTIRAAYVDYGQHPAARAPVEGI